MARRTATYKLMKKRILLAIGRAVYFLRFV